MVMPFQLGLVRDRGSFAPAALGSRETILVVIIRAGEGDATSSCGL